MPDPSPDLPNPRDRPIRDPGLFFGLWPWAKGPEWETEDEHRFTCLVPGWTHLGYRIPRGYRYNKASTPPLLWGPPFNYLPDGLARVPALEHDFLCDLLTGGSPWLKAHLSDTLPKCPPPQVVHEHFHLQMLRYGVRKSKADAWHAAVAMVGPKGRLRWK